MLTEEQKAYWHPTKNSHIDPNKIGSKSHKDAWWKCEQNHEWNTKISKFTSKCPFCSGRKVLQGFNDLATLYPQLLDEWDYEKNTIKPNEMLYKSSNKTHWKCINNHTWDTPLRNRTIFNSKCSYCIDKNLWEGFNDIQTKIPEVLEYWDYNKNPVLPSSIIYNSRDSFAWKDKTCGHEWKASLFNFRLAKQKCPYCANRTIQQDVNDFVTRYPEVFDEWDYEKNLIDPKSIKSDDVTKYWWIGKECNHTWVQTVNKRIYRKAGCVYCKNQQVLKGFNDLATTRPDIAKAWSSKNKIQPDELISRSKEKIILECEYKHETIVNLKSVFTQKEFCTVCLNRKLGKGFNDFATKQPLLAEEWSPQNSLSPSEVIFNSDEKVLWVCKEKQHVWRKSPKLRAAYPSCPDCLANSYSSKAEMEILEYVQTRFNYDTKTNVRNILPKSEIDIYINDLKLGIEYNGIHWHSTQFKKENYHLSKYLKAIQKGICLIQVSEYDYFFDKDLTLARIQAYFDRKQYDIPHFFIKKKKDEINVFYNENWVGKINYVENVSENLVIIKDSISKISMEFFLKEIINLFVGKKLIFEQSNEWPLPERVISNLNLTVSENKPPVIVNYLFRGQNHSVWDAGKTCFSINTDII